jgi:hypothetical protein
MECSGAKLYGELQRFEKSDVLGNVVVVMSNRFVYLEIFLVKIPKSGGYSGSERLPKRSVR